MRTMKRNEIIAVVLFILATVGTVAGIFAVERWRRSRLFTAELIARAPEHGNFYPRVLKAPVGEEVRLIIRNIDTVTHGFAIPALGVAVYEIKAGEVKVVKFMAEDRGSYPFMCTVWCSTEHMDMRGELVVE